MEKDTEILFFKDDFEVLNLISGENEVFSIIHFNENFEFKYQDLLRKDNKIFFEYKIINNINDFKIYDEEVIIKTTQNLFLYFKIINKKTKIKIFYKPENVNDLNLLIMGIKKLIKK